MKRLIKALSTALAAIILYESAAIPLAQAAALTPPLALPRSIGKMVQLPAVSKTEKTIYHIQDIHTDTAAQINLYGIVTELYKQASEEGKKLLVFVEGATGLLDSDLISSMPDKDAVRDVGAGLLRKGVLFGEEYAAITQAPGAIRLVGVEDPELYRQNGLARDLTKESRATVLIQVREISRQLTLLNKHNFNPTLARLEKMRQALNSNGSSFVDYVQALNAAAPKVIARHAEISTLVELANREKTLDFARIEAAHQRLIEDLAAQKSDAVLKQLMTQAVAIKEGRLSPLSYYSELLKTSGQANSVIESYVAYLKAADAVNIDGSLDALDAVENDVAKALIKHPMAQQLYSYQRWLERQEKFFALEMTPQEWKRQESTQLKNIVSTLKDINAFMAEQKTALGYGFETPIVPFKELARAEKGAVAFYRAATRRDQAMTKNIQTYLRNNKEESRLVAFIAGGFHTPGILKSFEATGNHVAVIRPQIETSIKLSDKVNFFRAQGGLVNAPAIKTSIETGIPPATSSTEVGFFTKWKSRITWPRVFSIGGVGGTGLEFVLDALDTIRKQLLALPADQQKEFSRQIGPHVGDMFRAIRRASGVPTGYGYPVVGGAIFNPIKQQLLCCGFNGYAFLVDSRTGQLVKEFSDFDDSVLAVSHDGKQIAALNKTRIRILDAESGQVIKKIKRGRRFTSVAFTTDNNKLVMGSDDGYIQIVKIDYDSITRDFHATDELITTLSVSPNNGDIAIGTADGEVRLFRANGTLIFAHKLQSNLYDKLVLSMAFSPDGKYLATGSANGDVNIIKANYGPTVRRFVGPGHPVRALSFENEGTQLAITDGATIHDIDLTPGYTADASDGWKEIKAKKSPAAGPLMLFMAAPYALAHLKEGLEKTIAAALPLMKSAPEHFRSGLNQIIQSLQLILKQANDEPADLEPIKEIHVSPATSMVFNKDGSKIVTINDMATAQLLDTENGELIVELKTKMSSINSVAFSPDESKIALGGRDVLSFADFLQSKVGLWDAKTGEMIFVSKANETNSLAFAPNGTRMVEGSGLGIMLWDLMNGKQLIEHGYAGGVIAAAYSPDGSKIVTGRKNGSVEIFDAKTARSIAEFGNFSERVRYVTFSPDGSQILAGGEADLFVLDVKTRELETVISEQSGWIISAAYSPDGSKILTGSDKGSVRLWDRSGKLLAQLNGPKGWIRAVSYSPDGSRVTAGSSDGTITTWDVSEFAVRGPAVQPKKKAKQDITGHHQADGIIEQVAPEPVQDDNDMYNAVSESELENPVKQKPVVLRGHDFYINKVAYSPDGKILASASFDETIKLWDVETKENIGTIATGGFVRSIAFSPDGRTLASASFNKPVRLWDVKEKKEIFSLENEFNSLSIAFSPSQKILATSDASFVRIWDLEDRIRLKILRGTSGPALFSPDGRFLATTSYDTDGIKIWDTSTWQLFKTFRLGERVRGTLAFSPDSKSLAFVVNGVLKVRNVETGKVKTTLSLKHMGRGLAFSADGRFLAAGSSDKKVRVWNLESDKEPYVFQHPVELHDVTFSPDGKTLATASNDKLVRLWDVSQITNPLPSGPSWTRVTTALFISVGATFSAAMMTGMNLRTTEPLPTSFWSNWGPLFWVAVVVAIVAGLWTYARRQAAQVTNVLDIDTPDEIVNKNFALQGHSGPVFSASFSSDGGKILTAGHDGTMRIWDTNTQVEQFSHKIDEGWFLSASFSPDQTKIVTTASGGRAIVWDAKTGEMLSSLKIDTKWIQTGRANSASFSPNGERIVTGNDGGKTWLWDAKTGGGLASFGNEETSNTVLSASFSPNGRKIVTGQRDGMTRVWDSGTTRELFPLEYRAEGPVTSASFSPDGTKIVTTVFGGGAAVWDAKTGKFLFSFTLHVKGGWVLSASFSPDGARIVTGDNGGMVRVWDANTGREIERLEGHTAAVLQVEFSPNGKKIVSTSGDRTVRIWDVSSIITPSTPGDDRLSPGTITSVGYYFGVFLERLLKRIANIIRPAKPVPFTEIVPDETLPFELFAHIEKGFKVINTSSNGQYTAAIYKEGPKTVIRILNLESGLPNTQVIVTELTPKSVAVSNDGKYVALGGDKKIVRVKMSDGVLENIRPGVKITAIAFSPGNQVIAAGGDGLWRIEEDGFTQLLRIREPYVESIDVSADGETVLVGYSDNIVELVDVNTGAVQGTLSAEEEGAYGVALNRDKKLAALIFHQDIRVMDVTTGEQIIALKREGGATSAISFENNPGSIVFIDSAGEVLRFNITDRLPKPAPITPRPAKKYGQIIVPNPFKAIISSAFTPDGRLVAQLSAKQGVESSQKITIANVESGQERFSIPLDANLNADRVAIDPTGKWVAVNLSQGHVHVFEMVGESYRLVANFVSSGDHYTNFLTFNPSNGRVIWGNRYAAEEGDIATGDQRKIFPHDSITLPIFYSSEGRYTATSKENIVFVPDNQNSGLAVNQFKGKGQVSDVAFGNSGNLIAAGYENGRATIWNTNTGDVILETSAPLSPDNAVQAVALEDDGRGFVLAYRSGAVERFRIRQLRPFEVLSNRDATYALLFGVAAKLDQWTLAFTLPEKTITLVFVIGILALITMYRQLRRAQIVTLDQRLTENGEEEQPVSPYHEQLAERYLKGDLQVPARDNYVGKLAEADVDLNVDPTSTNKTPDDKIRHYKAVALDRFAAAKRADDAGQKGEKVLVLTLSAGESSRMDNGVIADLVLQALDEDAEQFVDKSKLSVYGEGEKLQAYISGLVSITRSITPEAKDTAELLKDLLYSAKALNPAAKVNGRWYNLLAFNLMNVKKANDEMVAAGYGKRFIPGLLINEKYDEAIRFDLKRNNNYGFKDGEIEFIYQPLGYAVAATIEDTKAAIAADQIKLKERSFKTQADVAYAQRFAELNEGRVLYELGQKAEGHGWTFPSFLLNEGGHNTAPSVVSLIDRGWRGETLIKNVDNMVTIDDHWLAGLGMKIAEGKVATYEGSNPTVKEEGKGGGFGWLMVNGKRVKAQFEWDVAEASAKAAGIDIDEEIKRVPDSPFNNASLQVNVLQSFTLLFQRQFTDALSANDKTERDARLASLKSGFGEKMRLVPLVRVETITDGDGQKHPIVRVLFEMRAWEIQEAAIDRVGVIKTAGAESLVKKFKTPLFPDEAKPEQAAIYRQGQFGSLKKMNDYDDPTLQAHRAHKVDLVVNDAHRLFHFNSNERNTLSLANAIFRGRLWMVDPFFLGPIALVGTVAAIGMAYIYTNIREFLQTYGKRSPTAEQIPFDGRTIPDLAATPRPAHVQDLVERLKVFYNGERSKATKTDNVTYMTANLGEVLGENAVPKTEDAARFVERFNASYDGQLQNQAHVAFSNPSGAADSAAIKAATARVADGSHLFTYFSDAHVQQSPEKLLEDLHVPVHVNSPIVVLTSDPKLKTGSERLVPMLVKGGDPVLLALRIFSTRFANPDDAYNQLVNMIEEALNIKLGQDKLTDDVRQALIQAIQA